MPRNSGKLVAIIAVSSTTIGYRWRARRSEMPSRCDDRGASRRGRRPDSAAAFDHETIALDAATTPFAAKPAAVA